MGETNGTPDVDREALWEGFGEEMREMTRRAGMFDELVEALANIDRTFESYGKCRLPEYVRKEFAQVRAALAKARGDD